MGEEVLIGVLRGSGARQKKVRLNAAIIDPWLVVDWLRITAYLKDIRQSPVAAQAYARIFARNAGGCITGRSMPGCL